MRRTMIATACLLMAAPALAQSVGEKTGINSMLGVSPSTEDFVKEVAISDMFEIEASKLAQQKGNAAEKTFASQMVTDHSKTSTELKGLVSGGKVTAGWRELFLEFPDRFLVGTDSFTPERLHYVAEHARWSRQWLSDLPRDVAGKIGYRNGERLFGGPPQ